MRNREWQSTRRGVFRRIRTSVLERFRRRMLAVGLVVPVAGVVLALGVQFAMAQEGGEAASASASSNNIGGTIVISAAVVMTAALLAAGYAVARVGSAAMGAASERPELMVRALLFVALAEGIALWGFVVVLLLLGKM